MSVIANSEGVLISMWGNLLFESGKANLRDEAIDSLQTVIGLLKESTMNLRVEGHTDDVSPNTDKFPTNWFLSSARAASAANLLADTGIDRSRLQAVGLAETRPIAPNLTPEGRAKNRRVEIWILPPANQGPAAAATPRPAAAR